MSICRSMLSFVRYRLNALIRKLSRCIGLGSALSMLLTFNLCIVHADEQVGGSNADRGANALPKTANRLAVYFAVAEDLDRQVREASLLFNSARKSASGIMPADTEGTILELDSLTLSNLIPPGLPLHLGTAVLKIWANLDSRISGLRGSFHHAGMGNPGEPMVIRSQCIDRSIDAQDRFEVNLSDATTLANSKPWSAVPTGSVEAAKFAVRLAFIRKVNNCCDSCGGEEYEKPIAVDWENRKVRGVRFDATFNGREWVVFLHAG